MKTRRLLSGLMLSAGVCVAVGCPGTDDTIQCKVTFYGWPDNSPPGKAIANPVIHQEAGGIGTYDDPITFAADPNVFSYGTILYVPYLQRYIIMEDLCASCTGNWIDIWLNSDERLPDQTLECENELTRESAEVEVKPSGDRPVVTTPLFDPATGTCLAV